MRILLVKLSSLGDVVHALPAWADITRALPQAQVGWVVEPAFAPLLRAAGVQQVIEAPLRRWRGSPGGWWGAQARAGRRQLRADLQADAWDAVIDLQGLVKSAWVMRQARLSGDGFTAGLGSRTDGSGWEWPVRWMQQRNIELPKRTHAVQRGRWLVAQALGLAAPHAMSGAVLDGAAMQRRFSLESASLANTVVLVHGTTRADKLWPEPHWVELGKALLGQGFQVALPGAGAAEQARSTRLAAEMGAGASAWPEMGLDELAARMSACAGCVGVDSGVSHIAVALNLPHVQIYNLPTAWRTGPALGVFGTARQVAVEGQGVPGIAQVWAAWQGLPK